MEYLSRVVAPRLPNPAERAPERVLGTIVPLLTPEGKTHYFEIKGAMAEGTLAYYVLVPLTTGQWRNPDGALCPVIALFRDLDNKGAAPSPKEVADRQGLFYQAQRRIKACLSDSLPLNRECSVTCTGYALASVYAQLLALDLVEDRNDEWVVTSRDDEPQKTERFDESPLLRIKTLQLCAWDPEVLPSRVDSSFAAQQRGLKNCSNPLEVEKLLVFFAKPLSPAYSGTWLGSRDENTQIVKIAYRDTQTSYGRPYDPHTCMAMVAGDDIAVELLESRRAQDVLQVQRTYRWHAGRAASQLWRFVKWPKVY